MSEVSPRVPNPAQVIRPILLIVAVLVLLCSAALGLFWVSSHDPSRGETLLVAFGCMLVGLVCAILLIVASALMGMFASVLNSITPAATDDVRPALDRLEQSVRLLNSLQSQTQTVAGDAAGIANGRTVQLLDQIRDLALMNDEQRKTCAARHWERRKQTHLAGIEREVLVGDWVSAFARLEELQIVMPGDAQVKEMRERVESEQTSRLDEDTRAARGRLRQLMSAGLWQQAEDLVGALREKYPGKAQADRLADDVRREHEAFDRESMERLFRDISAATERRQWRQATLAVEEFIRRYPLDPRAEALRLDLPTLQENAAAAERKEQEEHFKDLLKRQRYEEAILTARAVVAKYPHSATATELNKLLPKVEELARQEALKVANQAAAATPAAAATESI